MHPTHKIYNDTPVHYVLPLTPLNLHGDYMKVVMHRYIKVALPPVTGTYLTVFFHM